MTSSPSESEPRYGRRMDSTDDAGPSAQPPQDQPGGDPYGAPSAPSGAAAAPQPQGTSPYGQNPYGASSYGADTYGSGPYGQNPQGPGPYGQNPQGPGPYGQNPYGSDPYGQQSPGGYVPQYTQPAQPPGWNPAAAPSGEKPKRPWTLITTLFLILGAGVVLVIAGITTMNQYLAETPESLASDPETFSGAFWDGYFAEAPAGEAAELLDVFAVMVMVFAVIGLFIYTGLAFVAAFAGNPGRIIATVVLAPGIIANLLSMFPYGAWMVLVAALSLAAIVLMWLPATSRFMHQRRQHRDGSSAGGHTPGSYPPGGGTPGAYAPGGGYSGPNAPGGAPPGSYPPGGGFPGGGSGPGYGQQP